MIAKDALMKKVGGIVAMVTGAAGLAVAVIGTFLSAIVAVFASSDAGIAVLLIGVGTTILCIAIMVLGIMAVKTKEVVTGRRLYGYLLILCAIAASALLFWLPFVLLTAQAGTGFLLLRQARRYAAVVVLG